MAYATFEFGRYQGDMSMHAIGRALGAREDGVGSWCAVCGASPFPVGRPAASVFGPNFVDWGLLERAHEDNVCEGCAKALGGKPSRANPPLRMSHFVVVGGVLDRVDGAGLLACLRRPPSEVEAVGWAVSRQKHVSLRCGPCTPDLLRVGCDHGTITWRPARDVALLDAVETLRSHARQDDILTGHYPPHVIQKIGLSRWRTAEAVVSTRRPSLHLDLAVALVRRPEIDQTEEVMSEIPESMRAAAELLHPLCMASAARDEDAINFWHALLPRRLASAASSASLTEWLGYLVEALSVTASRPEVVEVVRRLDEMGPEEAAEILSILRRDHRLVITVTRLVGEKQRL